MPGTEADRRAQRRLAEELEDDGIRLAVPDDATEALVIEELDRSRRSPTFEGRDLISGTIITSDRDVLRTWDGGVDLVEVPDDADPRPYADGRATFLLRDPNEPERATIACFERLLQYEADLVQLQEATGALVVQRTVVLAVTRLFQPGEVVSWDGRSWHTRATAGRLVPILCESAPELDEQVAKGALSLAVHWLAPARIGATLVLAGPTELDVSSFDLSGAATPPVLSITNRRHLPAIWSSLLQRDLAAIVDAGGVVRKVGVGLRAGADFDPLAGRDHGMRHRSALRWSVGHPDAVVVVVSADGPVTIYRAGEALIRAG